MTKIQEYTSKGVKAGEQTLPKEFDQKINMALLAQVVHVFEERSHVGLRKTKTRAEINRTTKKVYKQKGTGGARHGSRRANLFVGGGVALGPRPVRRVLNISDKMKERARLFAYNLKASEGNLVLVKGLSKIDKTKSVSELCNALTQATGAKRFTLILSDGGRDVVKYFRNFNSASAIFWRNANAYDIFGGGMIVLDSEIFPKKVEAKAKKVQVKAKETVSKAK
ncbi:MAG: 50S ribosomal protein L4 [Microgenomates group bacterium GW2011_GWC1_43_13]|uniref:Large ribosomal subunit protein uL4 n=3 Tax=Candidatus Woeseibacteriota TaxID=1752722 RepID=A0A837IA95_9BACT|nr:MAG: 50S ribosomal protein L4 [Microgenomates group bacterium GW2011_GWC1_43_13]KKT33537.1 MAG: 50S ribosomal protein L4 [Candidatus Woesebacteria bacterium GW2011_GWB1_44_11]KKT55026.1 MAG: 50S ribosomal protein L4 [Candidatus Woesebacteria bacterium GW2011_GWA1_44_23]OGM76752.1 MAG: 50S ribosomal protein L4 [Candidatus Woesebacteria bacterium RIFOXYA1_FULL_43_16]OGM83269.1 MAG: 50S ribosomal protein L4 [Candidatus Woesebacteria bacterium RIFOXYB1_FULL_42_36]OGM85058.1 MAG: 50S ribosomal p